MNKIIFIVGPTSSGKTKLAIKLANDLKLEIISIDAFQVYKELNVGVNKPTSKELEMIKHHFVNTLSINETWDVKKFYDEFYKLIDGSNKSYIGIGGSNLYISAVIDNYNFLEIKKFDFSKYTNEQLFNLLKKVDEKESEKISVNNRNRLEQSLNIVLSNNVKKSEIKNKEKKIIPYIIKIDIDREILYEKINKRVDEMMDNGWVQEVNSLKNKYDKNLNAFSAIGYKQIWNDLENNSNIDVNKIKQKTRNYAKRQETWCRNKFNINFTYQDESDYNNLLNECTKFLHK